MRKGPEISRRETRVVANALSSEFKEKHVALSKKKGRKKFWLGKKANSRPCADLSGGNMCTPSWRVSGRKKKVTTAACERKGGGQKKKNCIFLFWDKPYMTDLRFSRGRTRGRGR